jgi:phosphoserine aminotransferase
MVVIVWRSGEIWKCNQPFMPENLKHNFGAGPCIMPTSVIERASAAVLDWNGTGLSILEVSHRSEEFGQVMRKAESLVRELIRVPQDYAVLFLQGGASSQFSMVPLNLLDGGWKSRAAYLDTGYFALKAMAQALYYGKVEIIASSKDKGYNYIPRDYRVSEDVAYLHITSNNTIEGTQIFELPKVSVPLICDMSSDIFSRKVDVSAFDLIYAGAQKNLGPAGMTLVIVKQSLLDQVRKDVPAMSNYNMHKQNGSMYNTPPVFSIYVAMLNLMWLKEQGGVGAIEQLSKQKSELLYDAIDQSPLFFGLASKADRSRVNVTFKCYRGEDEGRFLRYAEERGIIGIKGFPSMGGFRVSMYNGMPLSSVEYLVRVMGHFEKLCELKGKSAVERSGAE